jgi:hypothetical protein
MSGDTGIEPKLTIPSKPNENNGGIKIKVKI